MATAGDTTRWTPAVSPDGTVPGETHLDIGTTEKRKQKQRH
ncbi:hypothetical protein D3OALGA1CA_3401 [Olavius algarvensis associated proteobacterium Delta 3]|nr:hypothetical protein D3OALGB2SA_3333 [Olavius algarvensis associated proteobacterium Delta 3]CAB5133790.1 hypothetical protein D3OALGA1CA_3401 [Olavius algarvensis associated proteobacterium Delta 3]